MQSYIIMTTTVAWREKHRLYNGLREVGGARGYTRMERQRNTKNTYFCEVNSDL